jgi:hypothetical protein
MPSPTRRRAVSPEVHRNAQVDGELIRHSTFSLDFAVGEDGAGRLADLFASARGRERLRRRMAEACPEFAPDAQPEEWLDLRCSSRGVFRTLA